MKELSMAETDEDVQNYRSQHIFMEYDSSHPACYFYLLAQCIKKLAYVAIALTMYNIYCYGLFISAMIAFTSLMYYSFVRPFKTAMHNIIIIYEDFMTFFCFVILFKFANSTSVESLDLSRSTAKFFSLAVFILVIVPAVLTLMEIVLGLKNIRQVCNWNRDYKDEKESFESS